MPIPDTQARSMDAAFEHFQIATSLINEGSRVAAAGHIKAALRALDRCHTPDAELRAALEDLLTHVRRNAAKEAA